MDSLFSVVIFIVLIVSAIAQKIQQSRAMKDDHPKDGGATSPPTPGQRAGQRTHGDVIPEAKVRPKRPQPHGRELGPPPKPPGQDLFESLFGPQAGKTEDEGDWRPAHQPARRAELPRTLQPEAREAPRRPERVPTRPAPQAREARPTTTPKPKQARSVTPPPQPKTRGVPAGPRPLRRPAPGRAAGGPADWLFGDRDDIRRGIIMSEILGPPKAFE